MSTKKPWNAGISRRNLLKVFGFGISTAGVASCMSLLEKKGTLGQPDVFRYARVQPVPHDAVDLTGGFWHNVRVRSRDVGVPTLLMQFEDHGHIENFRICAEGRDQEHFGGPNCNEFLYKHLEAMGWYSAESSTIAALHRDTARTVLSAQKSDGYLNTFYENPINKREGAQRFAPLNRFEFYNFGHFTQAAIAHYRATGDHQLLDAAIRFADLIVSQFAEPNHLPYKLYRGPVNLKYEHPNHELALVELYRVTDNRKYLDFVMQTLTEYGYFGGEHFNEIWGHAVQENLLEAGALDLYLETGDQSIWEIASHLWIDATQRKMYITGGTGSKRQGEAYGAPYELPNETAYCETCAAIALTFWHHRMLLATGDARYADEMDRTLYNNVLAGYGLDGATYLYRNPLEWDSDSTIRHSGHLLNERLPWQSTPCCPPNLHRLFATIDQYIYTCDDSGVYVNLYADSTLTHTLEDGQTIELAQTTGYPYAETISMAFDADPDAEGTIRLRIPQWCEEPQLEIAGEAYEGAIENGYLVVERPWKLGKSLVLTLPMRPRVVKGDPRVRDQINRIAILRGPIVYCIEQADNPGVALDHLTLPEEPLIEARFEPELLDGVVQLSVGAWQTRSNGAEQDTEVRLVPYYTWANRGPGAMMVWLPT